MRKLLLPFVLLLLLSTAATGDGRMTLTEEDSSDTIDSSTDSILKYWMRPRAVSNEKPFLKTIWCWLGTKELDTVKQLNSLLWDFHPHDKTELLYGLWLNDKSQDENPYVRILRGSNFQRIQSCWPEYWVSFSDRNEPVTGNQSQLVKVVLEDSALVAVYIPQEKGINKIRVFDMMGNMLSLPEFEKNRNRLAVVYFYGTVSGAYQKTNGEKTSRTPYPFRSMVLCNEQMIRSWHHGVPGVQHEIARDMNYLMLLYAWAEAHPGKSVYRNPKKNPESWTELKSKAQMKEYYMALQMQLLPGETNMQEEMRRSIDFIRSNWNNQLKPAEKFPSRGIR